MKLTYEYECADCGTDNVRKFTISEYLAQTDEVLLCQQCGGIMQRRITGGATVLFKGDGWADKRSGEE